MVSAPVFISYFPTISHFLSLIQEIFPGQYMFCNSHLSVTKLDSFVLHVEIQAMLEAITLFSYSMHKSEYDFIHCSVQEVFFDT